MSDYEQTNNISDSQLQEDNGLNSQNNIDINQGKQGGYIQPSYFNSPEYIAYQKKLYDRNRYNIERDKYKKYQFKVKLPLVFSLLGLLGSICFGLGLPFSVIGVVLAWSKLSKIKDGFLNYAMGIGMAGIAINLFFLVFTILSLV